MSLPTSEEIDVLMYKLAQATQVPVKYLAPYANIHSREDFERLEKIVAERWNSLRWRSPRIARFVRG